MIRHIVLPAYFGLMHTAILNLRVNFVTGKSKRSKVKKFKNECGQPHCNAMLKTCFFLPSVQIRLLEKITNAIISNVSGCVKSNILYTDLAITYIIERKVDYHYYHIKLWPLIVSKSKQAKPDSNIVFQMRFKFGSISRADIRYIITLLNTVIKWPDIDNVTNYSY